MVCDVNKIDSNVTGLAYAEEVCLKQLPTVAADGFAPTFYGLEPNSYSDFGGDLSTVARAPISANRQRKKGTVTGLEASGGFNTDLTQKNLTRLMQGFFFANARQKPQTKPFNSAAIALTSIATSDDSFNAAAGLSQFLVGHLVKVSKTSLNNGLFRVASKASAKLTVVENLTDEALPPAGAEIEAVGFQFGASAVTLTASAAAAVLAISGLAAAVGTYTITGATNFADGETVTIGSRVYTAETTLPLSANQFLVGADKAASLVNLAHAVNADEAYAGTLYGVGTVAHSQVTAVPGASTLVVTAIYAGTSGNSIVTTEVSTNGAWGAGTLAGGTGAAGWRELGLVAGEWIGVGGTLTAEQFTQSSSTNRPGYARISAISDAELTLDETTWTPQTDAGTGKTLRVWFGTLIRNEPDADDIVTRSYNIERTLGKDSAGVQAQYLEGAIANEFKLNIPEEDKLNADLTFIALQDATRTGLEGLKAGTRVAAPGESAFNTSLDLYRIKMAIHDDAEMNKDALFGFVTEADLTVNNNASQVKALGVLGGVDVNVGNFDTSGSITALFSTVEAVRAIRNNSDVGFNLIAARDNGGFIFDLPLLGLGGGRLNVELNSPITVPLDAAGAENALGYTLASIWFSYLPDVLMPNAA